MKPLVAFLPVYKDPKIPSCLGLPYLQGIQPLVALLVAGLQGIKPIEACCHVFRAYDPLVALGCQSTGHHTQNCFRDREKSRERGRDKEREREKSRERSHDRHRDCDHREDRHHRDLDRDRERERDRGQDRDRVRDRDRDRGRDRGLDHERDRNRDRDRGRDRDLTRERESERDYDVEDHDHGYGRSGHRESNYDQVESKHERDRHGQREKDHDHTEPEDDRGWYKQPEHGKVRIQIKTKTLSLMSVVKVEASMIIWMSRTTMTVMTNIMTVVMTNMIEWRMMITNMSVQHRSHVKGREQEMWSMSIDDRRGHFLGSTSTKAAGTSQLVLCRVSFNQISGVLFGATSFRKDVKFSLSVLTKLYV